MPASLSLTERTDRAMALALEVIERRNVEAFRASAPKRAQIDREATDASMDLLLALSGCALPRALRR